MKQADQVKSQNPANQPNCYNHVQVEEKWLQAWEKEELFQDTFNDRNDQAYQEPADQENKMYLLFAFAYPSGSGLHVGHVESKTALDIMARYYRMQGKDVFFPVGWDAFGLPAENYAIKTGVPPAKTTQQAIDTFRRQIKRVGISYDWTNELATCHPGYYQWTQWLFLQLYQAGLAYRDQGMVNWCPACKTVLANEQVVAGLCERCDAQVVQRELEQWYFKITEYKDELIEGLDQVDWPQATKQQQINWIGRSQGVEVDFKAEYKSEQNSISQNLTLTCFTTRIDTVFGTTFLVISPEKFKEYELLAQVPSAKQKAVAAYLDQAFKKTEEERRIGEKDKTGVDTGLMAINPVNQQAVPIFVADYVLAGVGTGVVMGVPGHDERDFAFAKKHGLEIKPVIKPQDRELEPDECFSQYGQMINSGQYSGLSSQEGQQQLVADFPQVMRKTVNYKLRDWLISRQRYWGAPIPIVYDPESKPHPVKEEHLPWKLPTDVDFKPTGESPLKSSKEFKERTEKLYGKGWTPEYDTMDTFVDSSWYYLRYLDSRNSEKFAQKKRLASWLPVDFYLIGPEHIVLHLLYSRFFTKFLRDQGQLDLPSGEPFSKMRHQGMILGPDHKKMSKSKGNVINPDEIIQKYGADTMRVYEMFMGPLEADKPWDDRAVQGVSRFLHKVHGLVLQSITNDFKQSDQGLEQKLHQTIKKVTQDIPALKFNTAIASLMELSNDWRSKGQAGLSLADTGKFVRLLAPFAPFMAEELWARLGQEFSVHQQVWPEFKPELAREEIISLPVQVNGKLRGQLEIALETANSKDKQVQAQVLKQAKTLPGVSKWLKGCKLKKELFVSGKIISLVVE